MKKTTLFSTIITLLGALFIITSLPGAASATEIGNGKNFGIGLAGGEPSGLSLNYYLNQKNALQGTIGLGFGDGNYFYGALDYLYNFKLVQKSPFNVDWYAGVGAYLGFWTDNNEGSGNDDKDGMFLGVHVPIGIKLLFNALPIDVFLQIAPGFTFIGHTGLHLSGSLGARWYF